MQKKSLCALWLALLLCLVSLAGLAEDRTIFQPAAYGESENEEDNYYVERTASDGSALYVLASYSETQRLYRATMDAEEPVLLQEKEAGYTYVMTKEDLEDLSDAKRKKAEEIVHYLIGGKDKVYALNYYTKKVGTVDDSGVTWVDTVLELPDTEIQESDYTYNREIYFTYHQDGKLYIGVRGEDWSSCVISVIDLGTGKLEAEYTVENAENMVPYLDGKVLVTRSREDKPGTDLYAVTPESGEAEKLVEGITESYNSPAGLCFDEGTGDIYYASDSQVFRTKPGGTPEVVAYVAGGYLSYNMPGYILGDTYVLSGYDGIYLRSVNEGVGGKQPIRIVGGWLPNAVNEFTKENPQTPVLSINRYYSTSEEMATAIMSGEEGLDIFSISGQYGGFNTLKNKGYMEPLSSSRAISDAVDRMYPVVANMLRNEAGEVVALPTELYVTGWSVNQSLWDKEFPGQELPRTWDEWLTLYEDWEATHDPEDEIGFYRSYNPKQELFYQAYQQFIMLSERDGKPVDFSDPALRDVLARIEALPYEEPDWETMTDSDHEEMNEYVNGPRIFTTDSMGMFQDPDAPVMVWDDVEEQRYLAYPTPVFTAGQEPLIPAQMEVLFINPNSTNKEASIKLLEYMLENMDNYLKYSLYPDLTEPVPNKYYEANLRDINKYIAEMQEDLKEASPEDQRSLEDSIKNQESYLEYFEETGHWELSEGAIKQFREHVGPYLYTNDTSLFMGYDGENSPQVILNEIVSRYTEGQLSLDEMLREMTQKARMIEQENR